MSKQRSPEEYFVEYATLVTETEMKVWTGIIKAIEPVQKEAKWLIAARIVNALVDRVYRPLIHVYPKDMTND